MTWLFIITFLSNCRLEMYLLTRLLFWHIHEFVGSGLYCELLSWRRHSFSYRSMSMTTVSEPLFAGLMIISSRWVLTNVWGFVFPVSLSCYVLCMVGLALRDGPLETVLLPPFKIAMCSLEKAPDLVFLFQFFFLNLFLIQIRTRI